MYCYILASGRGVETALNGVHGWVNAGDQPPPGVRPLKILFLDGRVAVSMGDQLLPRLEAREGSWARPAMAMRSALTAGIGVRATTNSALLTSHPAVSCCRLSCD